MITKKSVFICISPIKAENEIYERIWAHELAKTFIF